VQTSCPDESRTHPRERPVGTAAAAEANTAAAARAREVVAEGIFRCSAKWRPQTPGIKCRGKMSTQ
jgi:hypothetical protein